MFEVPSAKRVKRSQLFDDLGEEDVYSPEQTLTTKHREDSEDVGGLPDYGFEYEFVAKSPKSKQEPASLNTDQTTDNTEIYHFNLFAPTKTSAPKEADTLPGSDQIEAENEAQPLLISIRSPSPIPDIAQSLSFSNQRPDVYYFTSALPSNTLQRLRDAYTLSAISPSTLATLSKSYWPGTHQPWRVIRLPTNTKQVIVHKIPPLGPTTAPTPTTKSGDESSLSKARRRPRPSKKRRDLTRQKARKRQVIIDETKTKEEHEREKRNKKNRERKLKRRAKERREKEAMKGGNVDGGGDEDASGDDSGED